jgi:hypothetical protein
MSKVKLDDKQVLKWLEGQKEAEKLICREKVNFLLSLTPEKSLEIYLSLSELSCKNRREPSFLLLKMRQFLKRWIEKRGSTNASA